MGSSRLRIGVTSLIAASVLGLSATVSGASPPSSGQHHSSGTKLTISRVGAADSLLRVITWSGRRWLVLPTVGMVKGPEGVRLTNDPRAVYVDRRGRLHLKILKINGVWRSVELRSVSPVSYGRYRLINDTATARFSNRTVFGMFVYRPHAPKYTNEIDIENSRFPNYLKAPNNAQFAVQPYKAKHHEYPYHVKKHDVPLLQQFIWYPPVKGVGTVKFLTRVGRTSHSRALARWVYHGASDPLANNMYLFLTLWLNHGKPPKGGTHAATLRSLTVTPLR